MNVLVNGELLALDGAAALDAVVHRVMGAAGRGVAAAVNDAVVPRARWATHMVADGDRIEIVRAVKGG